MNIHSAINAEIFVQIGSFD